MLPTGSIKKSLEHTYEPSEAHQTLLASLCELIHTIRRGKVLSIDDFGGLAGIVICNYPPNSLTMNLVYHEGALEKTQDKNVVCVDL